MSQLNCQGWWEQDWLGRQPMRPLSLCFENGEITGHGSDVIGPFRFTGAMAGGHVVMRKQYQDKHAVDYRGRYDGEGTLYGTWQAGGCRGDWAIRLIAAEPNAEIRELR